MNSSVLLSKSKAIIYGIGGNGIKTYQLLKANNIEVEGFIDKRAKEHAYIENTKVYSLQEITEKILDKNGIVVFVTLKNVFIHNEIVNELLRAGFHYVIYKSLNALNNVANSNEIEIDRAYEEIIEHVQFNTDFTVPYLYSANYHFIDRLKIKVNENAYVVSWVPIELLFNYRDAKDYPGINMPLMFPLVELYKAFLGDDNIDSKEALDNFFLYSGEWLHRNNNKPTNDQQASMFESRASIFQHMQKMAEADISFFQKNAPVAQYENGKFFLESSGRNRVAFLIAKGYKYIPVQMSQGDYDLWCDRPLINQYEEKINSKNINIFFAPYPNPYLVDFPVIYADYMTQFIIPIANEIVKDIYLQSVVEDDNVRIVDTQLVEKQKHIYSIICRIDDNGIANRYFRSIGLTDYDTEREEIYKVEIVDYNIGKIIDTTANRLYVLENEYDLNDDVLIKIDGYKMIGIISKGVSNTGWIRGIKYEKG